VNGQPCQSEGTGPQYLNFRFFLLDREVPNFYSRRAEEKIHVKKKQPNIKKAVHAVLAVHLLNGLKNMND